MLTNSMLSPAEEREKKRVTLMEIRPPQRQGVDLNVPPEEPVDMTVSKPVPMALGKQPDSAILSEAKRRGLV